MYLANAYKDRCIDQVSVCGLINDKRTLTSTDILHRPFLDSCCTHTDTHTHTHTHIYIYIHTHTRTHTAYDVRQYTRRQICISINMVDNSGREFVDNRLTKMSLCFCYCCCLSDRLLIVREWRTISITRVKLFVISWWIQVANLYRLP